MSRKAKILLSICGGIVALGCFSEYVFSDTEASQYPREYQFTKAKDEVHQYGMHALHVKRVHILHKRHVKRLDHTKNVIKHKAERLDLEHLHEIGNRHCRGVNRIYGYIKYPKYHHNYWSFYQTHHVPMFYKNHQHMSLNQDVLKAHSVKNGINFKNSNSESTSLSNTMNNQNNAQGSSENQQ